MQEQYDPQQIEAEIQRRWASERTFAVTEDDSREKFYCLSMFPYPSGRLHMGHVRNYTIGDVISRYQRMQGRNVLQPMGWDAFGLPAENAAIQNNVPPARWTRSNIEHMRAQLQRLGFAYDWDRELATCDADYYHWEQWFFARLFEKGLVYRKQAVVNWDPVDQTVLANEQVIDGCGWRSGAPVERREIPQWFVRITAYADELLDELDRLDGWPEAVKTMQRNWIGRSEGLEVRFALEDGSGDLEVFTTRPDTLFGVTYMAVAPEHPLALDAARGDPALQSFLDECTRTGTSEAVIEKLEKKGMPLGRSVIHPLTGAAVPVWTANFVLMSYGTGAVMSVPAHDQRDWEFARAYGLPIQQVIEAADGSAVDIDAAAFVAKGTLCNSGRFDGLDSAAAFDAMAGELESSDRAERRVQYRLRDWLVSRQRYWGCPIPVVYGEDGNPVPETDERLPVRLPEEIDWKGVTSPLKSMPEFLSAVTPDGAPATRETDTFDTFFESSWYFARFCCPDADAMVDERVRYWMPVDIYIGGIEHAVLHLLYARFFTKLMRDAGLLDCDEPFINLLTQGMVVKETFFRELAGGNKEYFSPSEVVVESDDRGRTVTARLAADDAPVEVGPIEKMSKSKNNGVDPQILIDRYGADTVRLYAMFAAPPDQSLEWSDSAVEGQYRFLRSLWRTTWEHVQRGPMVALDPSALSDPQRELRRKTHETIAKVSDDVGRRYKFNTAIAAVMELNNALGRGRDDSDQGRAVTQEALETIVRLLAPITPHCAEAMWAALRNDGTEVGLAPWPVVDESALERATIDLVVQVQGRKRAVLTLPVDADRAQIEALAKADDNVRRFIEGKEIVKVVVVPGRLVNIVVKG